MSARYRATPLAESVGGNLPGQVKVCMRYTNGSETETNDNTTMLYASKEHGM
jgi:hypothetical protein